MERMMRKKKETIRRRKMEKNKDVEKFREGKNKIQSTAARSKMKVKRCEFGRTKKEGWKRAKMRKERMTVTRVTVGKLQGQVWKCKLPI